MRIAIEVPGELLQGARQQAAKAGITLTEFLLSALKLRMIAPGQQRLPFPAVQGPPGMSLLAREEIDEAMLG